MTIDEFLKLEKKARRNKTWFSGNFVVKNDNGNTVTVSIKSFEFYNQILRLNDNGIDYSSGHTYSKVKEMHEYLRKRLNEF